MAPFRGRTRGHSLSIHADTEQRTPSVATEGESIVAEEEPNRYEFEWLKTMNIEIEWMSEVQEMRKDYNTERRMKYIEKEAVKQEKSRKGQRLEITSGSFEHQRLEEIEPSHKGYNRAEHHLGVLPLWTRRS